MFKSDMSKGVCPRGMYKGICSGVYLSYVNGGTFKWVGGMSKGVCNRA